MVTKFISIRSVLDTLQDTIPTQFWNEMTMLEHCSRSMDMIGAKPQYEDNIWFAKVENHKTCLPKGLIQINQIAYRVDGCITDKDKDSINEILGIKPGQFMDNSNLWKLASFFSSDYYCKYWKPLRLSTNTFAKAIHVDNCPNLYVDCDQTYTVSPDGTMTTSFKDGIVCFSYTSVPVDCNGDFLIPDTEYYKDALRCYCMMRIWEYRMNMKEEGADKLFSYYQNQWSLMKGKAVSSIREPDLAELENIKNVWTRLIPKSRRFSGFFGNLASEERTKF